MALGLATAVPLAQASFSIIFQARFLSGLPLVGIVASLLLILWSTHTLRKQHSQLTQDVKSLLNIYKKWPFVSAILGLSLIYGILQVLLLPATNIDGATYHLPRVWLFIQENTLFLEQFTRYHEVIFPVGSDILFYPFLALGTTAGISIYSFTSYIAIGAAVYSIARNYTSPRNSIVCMLVMMSLNVIVLQSVSIKNDIIMANAAITALAITLRLSSGSSYRHLLLLLCLCAFGASTKTSFPAFAIGLLIIVIWKLKLWKSDTLARLISEARANCKLTLLLIIPLLITSQIWLYAWNASNYQGWSGPESFTHRHQQHDGIKGLIANSTRYAFQSLETGFITDNILAPAFQIPSLSDLLNQTYIDHLEPHFQEAGSERGPFEKQTLTQEDYSWFGLCGTLVLFVLTPLAILRKPQVLLALTPAILYFFILSGTISWMIWNGRFMTTFFLSLTPAVAIALNYYNHKLLRASLIFIASITLLIVKTTDFNRPLIAIGKMVSREKSITPKSVYEYSFKDGENIWTKAMNGNRLNPGNPKELLNQIPHGAEVALIGFGHLGHFNFYTARPDIVWRPLNGSLNYGEIDTPAALGKFIQSEYLFCVIIGAMPAGIPYNLARHCTDNYGHVITKKASAQ